jgi:hypothetical protein
VGEVVVEEEPLHWHYASTAGLLGILSSSSLWASHAATLNDSTEIRFGMDLVRRRVPQSPDEVAAWREFAEATSSWSETSAVPALINIFLDVIEGLLLDGGVYVFCASLAGDSLSQWRGYGGGAGSGFAIGLRPDRLHYKWAEHIHLTAEEGRRQLPMSLHPAWRGVIYEQVKQEAVVDQFFKDMAFLLADVKIPSGSPADVKRILNDLASMLTWHYAELVSSLKDRAFSEEQEVRVAVGGPNLPQRASLRPGAFGPLAFVELAAPDHQPVHFDSDGSPYETYTTQGLGRLPIEVVRIGPSPQPQMAREGVQAALTRHGYNDVRVVQSNVPFR